LVSDQIMTRAQGNRGDSRVVPPQNPVDHTIVDVSRLGVKLAYPDD